MSNSSTRSAFLSWISSVLILIAVFQYSLTPKLAHAGLFSFMSDLGGEQASAKVMDNSTTPNSQNMLLLEAAVNTDPNPYKKDTQTILAFNNALYAEIGPQGSVSDIDERLSTDISLYTVRDGDNLSNIAKMFDVSVNTIIWANELGRNPVITEGQTLVILPISGVKYVVKKGDTIKGIVYRYKANLDDVLQYNNLTVSSILSVGDVIVIPDAELAAPSVLKKTNKANKIVPENKPYDTNGPYYPGYYIKPVHDSYASQGLHGHNAVDLAAPIGTVIRASASGKVISSVSNGEWNGGYGNFVIIAHDNGTQHCILTT